MDDASTPGVERTFSPGVLECDKDSVESVALLDTVTVVTVLSVESVVLEKPEVVTSADNLLAGRWPEASVDVT